MCATHHLFLCSCRRWTTWRIWTTKGWTWRGSECLGANPQISWVVYGYIYIYWVYIYITSLPLYILGIYMGITLVYIYITQLIMYFIMGNGIETTNKYIYIYITNDYFDWLVVSTCFNTFLYNWKEARHRNGRMILRDPFLFSRGLEPSKQSSEYVYIYI